MRTQLLLCWRHAHTQASKPLARFQEASLPGVQRVLLAAHRAEEAPAEATSPAGHDLFRDERRHSCLHFETATISRFLGFGSRRRQEGSRQPVRESPRRIETAREPRTDEGRAGRFFTIHRCQEDFVFQLAQLFGSQRCLEQKHLTLFLVSGQRARAHFSELTIVNIVGLVA